MARLPLVTPEQAGVGTKLAFWFTRRGMRKLTGRETPTMLEPLQVYAHVPFLRELHRVRHQVEEDLP